LAGVVDFLIALLILVSLSFEFWLN
jgi:hypothetical protein